MQHSCFKAWCHYLFIYLFCLPVWRRHFYRTREGRKERIWWADCRESCCQRAGKPRLVSHIKLWPSLCGYHRDESWGRLSHVELMDRWGWEQGAAGPTPPKNTAHHISASCTHTHTYTHRYKTLEKLGGIRGEPVIKEHFSSLISIACLMRKNTSGFCGQQPSLIILKRNTTPPQLKLRTFYSAAVWEKILDEDRGGKSNLCSFSISPISFGQL